MDQDNGRVPSRMEAAAEIGELVNRIIALAPVAGLYVGIKIEPADSNRGSHDQG